MMLFVIATLSAYFIKGLCGFGNTPVFNSITALNYDNKNISPIELLVGLPANVVISIRGRKRINYSMCLKLVVFIFIGAALGTYMLSSINPRIIKVLCGVVIIFVAIRLSVNEDVKLFENRLFVVLTSLFSGLICGLYGIGVFMVPYVRNKSLTNEEFKSNMGFISMFDNLLRVFLYVTSGILTLSAIKTACILIPFSIVSLYFGFYVSRFVNEKLAKQLAMLLLVITGIVLIVNNIG